jgi:predicted phage terminase large subunit-like protein
LVIIDEAAEWTEKQILFLMSRMRSATYKGHLQMILSCNPNRMSFLRTWLDYCINEHDGIPVEGTANMVRWFVSTDSGMKWANSKEELFAEYGQGKTEGVDFIAKTLCFKPLTVFSNKILLKMNPEYLASLLALNRVDKERFLYGSWNAIASSSGSFKREWVQMIDAPPTDSVSKWRGWDLAASLPSETYKDPDWTAGTLLSKNKEGYYTIEDLVRFRARTDEVLRTIAETGVSDGVDEVRVAIPRDPAQAGLVACQFFTRYLSERGIIVSNLPTTGHSSKMNAILPFFALCEAGMVRCVKGDWNEALFSEFEIMDGSRKNKDDICDSVSIAFKKMASSMQLPVFSLPNLPILQSPIPKI